MSRRKNALRTAPRQHPLAAILAVSIAAVLAAPATAQESGKTWTVLTPAPSGPTTEFATQQQAVEAFQTSQVPFPIWPEIKEIKSAEVGADGTVTISYWMGKGPPADPNWSFHPGGDINRKKPTEQEAYDLILADLNAGNPACPPSATLTQKTDWTPLTPTTQGRFERKTFNSTSMIGDNTPSSPCQISNGGEQSMTRSRRMQCPPNLEWSDQHDACANDYFVAKIKGPGEECEARDGGAQLASASKPADKTSPLVGNPCNVKTGEKYEVETDVELGWISFSRYYHSGIANTTAGFGPGWTHSHDIKLSISGANVALIDGSGYQLRFRQDGANYWATDNSGERLTQNGSQWVLYRAASVMAFDSKGRLLSQQAENGTSLSYAYNSSGRLDSITHSTGRSLKINYDGDMAEASITSLSSAGVALVEYGYGPKRQIASATYPNSGTRVYHYEDTRYPLHLTGITAEDNVRFSTFAYDAKGRVVSSQHAGGADGVTLAYKATGGADVTDALGEVTTYGLTATPASGTPRKVGDVEDSRGVLKQSYYDETTDFRRRLKLVEDRRGIKTQHSYAEASDPVTGQLARSHTIQEALGLPEERTRLERQDVSSNRLIFSKVGDRETRIMRNTRLQPISIAVKDAATSEIRTTTYSYCESADVAAPSTTCPALGLVKSIDGPRTDVSDVVTFSYYGADEASCAATPAACLYRKGDLWKVTDALGRSTEILGYDALGRPLSQMDINGVVTDTSYHIRGWPVSIKVRGANNASETDDRITLFDYWPTGLVKKVMLPDGSFTTHTYDAAQRLTDVTDNAGDTIHYTLDLAGNRRVEDTKTSGGTVKHTLSRVYNALGQLEADKNAALNATTYGYDAESNVVSVTDALGRQATQSRDPLNRLSRLLQDVTGTGQPTQNTETKFTYNVFDQVTKVTDPKGLDTTYTYNAFGDRTQLISPDTGATTYTFDAAGNVKTATDARGVTRINTHDALNRLTATTFPDASQNVSYAYDLASSVCPAGEQFGQGRRATMTDSSGNTAYCYDRFGQLVRKVQTTNGVMLTVKYAYNVAGQLTGLTYPDGTVADYTHDSRGRIASIGVTPPGGTRELLLTISGYNPFGPATGWTYGNGRAFTRTFDLNYAVQSLRDTAVGGLDLGFARNEVLQITAVHNAALATPARVKFDYDRLDRLTKFRDGSTDVVQEAYEYDTTGNRTKFTNNGGADTYAYGSSNHRLSTVGGVARGFDAIGNTTSIGGTAKEFVYGANGRMAQVKQAGAALMNYAYNGSGQRVRSYLGTSNTYTVYDVAGQWLGDYGNGGVAIQQAVWLNENPVGLVVGAPVAVGRLHYVQPDHLGTPRAVIDPVRNVAVWTWDMASEVFGNSAPNQDPDLDATAFVFNMRFPGQRYDAASGLNHNYFRDYEPSTGRYIQSDPIGLSGGISTYGYAYSSPTTAADPLGLQPPPPAAGAMSLMLARGAAPPPPGYAPADPWDTGRNPYSTSALECRIAELGESLLPLAQGLPMLLLKGGLVVLSSEHPGFWDGPRGAEEWGRRNGVDPARARNKFHDIKQSEKGQGGGKGLDKYMVNPDTGEIINPQGEVVDKLGDHLGEGD